MIQDVWKMGAIEALKIFLLALCPASSSGLLTCTVPLCLNNPHIVVEDGTASVKVKPCLKYSFLVVFNFFYVAQIHKIYDKHDIFWSCTVHEYISCSLYICKEIELYRIFIRPLFVFVWFLYPYAFSPLNFVFLRAVQSATTETGLRPK